jgi:predicted RNase H-like HicB family nuclease
MLMRTFTSVIYKEGEIYVGECPEVGTVSQGYTIEEVIANLKEATELYLEECLSKERSSTGLCIKEFVLRKSSKPIISTFDTTINV